MHTQTLLRLAPAVVLGLAASLGAGGVRAAEAAAAAAPAAPSAPVSGGLPAPLPTIARLDLPRYMGRWYELARYPNRFQRDCSGPATADYALLPTGAVQVVNRCPQPGGKVDQAIGEARRVGAEGSPTLQVRFAPAWLSFLPQVWGAYWVVELDADYQLAVVSEPQREFLWVLSRQPTLPAAQWAALEERLRALGFDPARLIRSGEP